MADIKYFPEPTLEHGAWKHHKYIRKEGKKYIYSDSYTDDYGTTHDRYESEDGDTIIKTADYKYDPKRYDRSDLAKDVKEKGPEYKDRDTLVADIKEKTKKLFDEKPDKEEEEKKYFAKHDDMKKSDSLAHHGILGQKWGVRRYQNADGTLTEEGRKRVSQGIEGVGKTLEEGHSKAYRKRFFGGVKAGVGAIGTVGAGTAIGAGVGSLAGPAGTALGAGVGYVSGAIAALPVSYIMAKKSATKAATIEDQYRFLGDKMMKELSTTKISDIDGYDGGESSAKAAAKKAGLDQGDNWKMYRDAKNGDKNAQKVVEQWEKEKADSYEKHKKK